MNAPMTAASATDLARMLADVAKRIETMPPSHRETFDRACRLYDVEPPKLRHEKPEAGR
jgi:hypothetical protein